MDKLMYAVRMHKTQALGRKKQVNQKVYLLFLFPRFYYICFVSSCIIFLKLIQ